MQSSKINLAETIAKIQQNGPTRVVTDNECRATTTNDALLNFGIVPEVVFIREDGWSLGAPQHLADVAREMWAGQWIAEIRV